MKLKVMIDGVEYDSVFEGEPFRPRPPMFIIRAFYDDNSFDDHIEMSYEDAVDRILAVHAEGHGIGDIYLYKVNPISVPIYFSTSVSFEEDMQK